MFSFLQTNGRLTKFQATYTPGSSTITQLLEIYNHIQVALDESKEVRFVFCIRQSLAQGDTTQITEDGHNREIINMVQKLSRRQKTKSSPQWQIAKIKL